MLMRFKKSKDREWDKEKHDHGHSITRSARDSIIITTPEGIIAGRKDSASADMDDENEVRNEEEYQRIMKRLSERGVDVDLRSVDYIEMTESKAREMSEEQVALMVEILIGKRSTWSSEGEEALDFRESLKRIREECRRRCGSADVETLTELALPPIYLCSEPLPAGFSTAVYIVVHYTWNSSSKLTKKMHCDGNSTAREFMEEVVRKLSPVYPFIQADGSKYIFKANGAVEYLYGAHRVLDFQCVRTRLKRGDKEIELTMLDFDELVHSGKVDIARSVDYQETPEQIRTKEAMFEHSKLSISEPTEEPWYKRTHISLWDVKRPFRIRLRGVSAIRVTKQLAKAIPEVSNGEAILFVVAALYHGGRPLAAKRVSRGVVFSSGARFQQWLEFPDLKLSNIPRAARICFTVYCRPYSANDPLLNVQIGNHGLPTYTHSARDFPVGWVATQLMDHKGYLRQGIHAMRVWPHEAANPIGTTIENLGSEKAPVLDVEFLRFSLPVVFPSGSPPQSWINEFKERDEKEKRKLYMSFSWENSLITGELAFVIKTDPLYQLTDENKLIVWHHRKELKKNSKGLVKFLSSVQWNDPVAVWEAHAYMDEWAPLEPLDALELLDSNHADPKVRFYAVQQLGKLSDNEINDLILQLVQTLKYEPYHDSPLVRFLLTRGVRSNHLIGHLFFWYLKSEMHINYIRERNGLLLEEYLTACNLHRLDLIKQNFVVSQLLSIAFKIKHTPKAEMNTVLRRELGLMTLPKYFKLPLSPRMECNGIIVDKCKVMSSKKLPLWLVFQNADQTGGDIYVIFKAGDDLRQDMLTLQILKIMDRFWKENGLDLHLNPYGCISTGDGVGMIEVVQNADTVANITFKYGGAPAAFENKPLLDWLERQNEKNPLKIADAKKNFVFSCAGYCVATYVLGIGDRHNDNIMLTKRGDLFHIDFGHFLGNYKTKFGIRRETAPFVFTPMYRHVMGGANGTDFKAYCELAAKAFNIIRKYAHLFENLFKLMLSTGIPELRELEDILWIKKCMMVDEQSDEVARTKFQDLIHEAVVNKRQVTGDFIHIQKHKHKSKS